MSTPPSPPRLLDLVRQLARARFGQEGPGECYAFWTKRLIFFFDKRHPKELSPGEVGRFLEHVAQTEKNALSCLEQAHTALTFLYHEVLGLPVGELPCPEPPRLLDRIRRACRVRQYSPRTEDCYVDWATRFIRFHGLRHPHAMAEYSPQISHIYDPLVYLLCESVPSTKRTTPGRSTFCFAPALIHSSTVYATYPPLQSHPDHCTTAPPSQAQTTRTITRYQQRQITPTTPQRPHTRQTITLATQMTT